MSIEFLLVTFSDKRVVMADGDPVGITNHVLMMPADEYIITLQGAGYAPPNQDVVLAGTSIMRPKVIAFQ